jgi:hypothetical protein
MDAILIIGWFILVGVSYKGAELVLKKTNKL